MVIYSSGIPVRFAYAALMASTTLTFAANSAGSSPFTSISAKVYTYTARIAVCVQVVVLDSVRVIVVADSVVVLDNVVLLALVVVLL